MRQLYKNRSDLIRLTSSERLCVVREAEAFWESDKVGKSSSMSITSSRPSSSLEEQMTNNRWTWPTADWDCIECVQDGLGLVEGQTSSYMLSRALSWPSPVGGSQACSLTFHSLICWSQERRLYFLNLLGVFGWTPGWRMCLKTKKVKRKKQWKHEVNVLFYYLLY